MAKIRTMNSSIEIRYELHKLHHEEQLRWDGDYF